jgi:hypothetical protein
MKKIKLIFAVLLITLFSFNTHAENEYVRKFVATINSVEKAKAELRTAFLGLDSCQDGSCFSEVSMYICDIVAALDVNANGQIFSGWRTGYYTIAIPANDLVFMRNVFAQCKPTNYQYWIYPLVLHVVYNPDGEQNAAIREYLFNEQ